MTHRLAWTACAVFLCSIGASAAASDMAPGAWEYTMKTSVPGVPVSTPGVTARICLSEKDVPYAMATTGPGSKGDCRYENLRSAGGKTRYDMVCQGSDAPSGQFEFRSTATTVDGRGVIRSGSSKVIQEWHGQRVGDCQ